MFKLIILLSCINLALSIEQTPEVKVSQGIVRGIKQKTIWGKDFNSFNGIPFAKPPIGKLRFKAPVPAEPWIGIWNATDVPNACSQAGLGDHFAYSGDEDCLYVNVHTPELPLKNSKLKDVLVFIHGGGFQVLSGDLYGPEYILEREIVFVTFNYRLGPFGFLSLEDDVLSGNNGLWDQNLALKWVKKNIASFGGDPKKITISGMSAGGASVHYHLLSKHSKGLFQKAIVSSGAVFNPWAIAEKPREYAIKVAANLGCPDGSSEEILKCVKQRPAKDILVATHKLRDYGMLPIAPVGPIIEKPSSKAFIDKQPYDIIEEGEMNDVPTLWTVNSEEGLFPGSVVVQDESGIVEQNWDKLLPSILEFQNTAKANQVVQIAHQIREHYLGGKPMRTNVEGALKIFSDRLFYNGIYDAINAHVEHGKAPIHVYQFSYVGEKRLSDSTGIHEHYKGGACHADDNHYVFRAKYMPMDGNTNAEKMIKTTTNLWMEFIEGSPSWEPVKPGALKYLDVVCTDPANNKVKTVTPTSGQLMWKSFGLAENRGELIEPDYRHNEL